MLDTMLAFDAHVVDGEGEPVPGVEVGVRYRYPTAPRTWSSEYTDGAGCAHFRDSHEEPPIDGCLFVGDYDCGSYMLTDGADFVLEM